MNNLIVDDYRYWCISKVVDGLSVDDRNNLIIENEYARANINFYDNQLVEFSIINLSIKESEFYLHFQLNNLRHAQQLFEELLDTFNHVQDHKSVKVLLCCSSALTTSYFSEELNKISNNTKSIYEFNAVSFDKIYDVGRDYDIILLAPQIGYNLKKVSEVFKDHLVLQIPANIFGSYDCVKLINFVDEKRNGVNKQEIVSDSYLNHNHRILIVGTRPDGLKVQICYRIYDRGQVSYEKKIVRGPRHLLSLSDFDDIFDTILLNPKIFGKIDGVGIAITGQITNDVLDLNCSNIQNVNLKDYFETKYQKKFIIENNVNAVAVGFHYKHDYHNLIVHSQPIGFDNGGQGIIINDKLIKGLGNVAGEVKYINRITNPYYEALAKDSFNPDRVLDVVVANLVCDISLFGPEAIAIRCEMINDLNEVRRKLLGVFPEACIPELYKIDEYFMEKMFMGQLILCEENL